jgi:uncharacterized membrane protein (DUF485 family)
MTDLLKPIQPYLTLGGQLCLIFYVVFVIALAFWIWRDAQLRGAMSWFWAIAAVPFSVATWMIYMIVRSPDTLDEAHEREIEIAAREAELAHYGATCPNCFKPVDPDFLICPTCMKKLKKPCATCGRPIKLTWTVCPYCKSKQSPADLSSDSPSTAKRSKASRATNDALPDDA